MNSLIVPFSIHSETITNCPSSIVTPRSGNTFGWFKAFHLIASLQNLCTITVSQPTLTFKVTHSLNFVQVACQVYPQGLGCDSPALMLTHPHVCEPAAVLWGLESIETKGDLEGARKQTPVATYVTQGGQRVLPVPRREIGNIQSLIDAG